MESAFHEKGSVKAKLDKTGNTKKRSDQKEVPLFRYQYGSVSAKFWPLYQADGKLQALLRRALAIPYVYSTITKPISEPKAITLKNKMLWPLRIHGRLWYHERSENFAGWWYWGEYHQSIKIADTIFTCSKAGQCGPNGLTSPPSGRRTPSDAFPKPAFCNPSTINPEQQWENQSRRLEIRLENKICRLKKGLTIVS